MRWFVMENEVLLRLLQLLQPKSELQNWLVRKLLQKQLLVKMPDELLRRKRVKLLQRLQDVRQLKKQDWHRRLQRKLKRKLSDKLRLKQRRRLRLLLVLLQKLLPELLLNRLPNKLLLNRLPVRLRLIVRLPS